MYLSKYILFLTHSIFQLLVDSCRLLLLRHYICSAILYVTCFCHSAFCSLLFFFVCFLIVLIVLNIFTINLHVLFSSLYFPLMISQSLSLYDDTLLSSSVYQAICFIVLLISCHSCLLLCIPLCYLYFIRWWVPICLFFVFFFFLWLKVIYLYIASSVTPVFLMGYR